MSKYPLVTGQPGFTEQQPIRNTWSASTGFTLTRVWEGPSELYDAFVQNELPVGFSEMETEHKATGVTIVKATYGSQIVAGNVIENPDPLTTTWTMQGAMDQRHLLEHPKTFTLNTRKNGWPTAIENLAKTYHAEVYDAIKRAVAPAAPKTFTWVGTTATSGWDVPGATDDEKTWANQLYRALVRNPDASYIQPTYVLRKTQVMNRLTQQVAAYQYVGYILSYTALLSAEPTLSEQPYSPDLVLLGLTGLDAYKWHKQSPQTEQMGKGKFQLTQEYVGVMEYEEFSYPYLETWPGA